MHVVGRILAPMIFTPGVIPVIIFCYMAKSIHCFKFVVICYTAIENQYNATFFLVHCVLYHTGQISLLQMC